MIEKEGGGVGIQRPVFLEQTETGKNCPFTTYTITKRIMQQVVVDFVEFGDTCEH